MDQPASYMNAQITKIKADTADTLFITTAVEQITLVLKQAQDQRLTRKIITTGGSSAPGQLIKQAGAAAEGTYHIVFFMPWFPEAMPDGRLAKAFVDEWTKRGHPFDGLTEGFRGHDGVATAAEAIKVAGKPDPKAVRDVRGARARVRQLLRGHSDRDRGGRRRRCALRSPPAPPPARRVDRHRDARHDRRVDRDAERRAARVGRRRQERADPAALAA